MAEDVALMMGRSLLGEASRAREDEKERRKRENYRLREERRPKSPTMQCAHCRKTFKRKKLAAYYNDAGAKRRICRRCNDRLDKELVEGFS